jgi:hypothetical protein
MFGHPFPHRKVPAARRARRILCWAIVAFLGLQVIASLKQTTSLSKRFNEVDLVQVPSLAESIVQWQVSNLFDDIGPMDVVFFGDSSCLMGVMPRVVEEETALRCWNFGTLGWLSTDGHADLLQLFVDRHGPPRLAVYYVTTWPLTATQKDIETCGYLKRLREWLVEDTEGIDSGWLDRLPSSKMRFWLQTLISHYFVHDRERERFLNSPRGLYPSDAVVHGLLKTSHGFMAEVSTGKTEADWQEHARTLRELARPKLASDCISGLRHMFALADARGFDLIVRMNPLPEAFRSAEADAAFAGLEADLQTLTASYQRVHIVSPILRYYPNSLHSTVTHLSEAGARQNSAELADLVTHFPRGLASAGNSQE